MPEVKRSFALEKTPCIVYQRDNRFVVEEFNIEETLPAEDKAKGTEVKEELNIPLETPLFR